MDSKNPFLFSFLKKHEPEEEKPSIESRRQRIRASSQAMFEELERMDSEMKQYLKIDTDGPTEEQVACLTAVNDRGERELGLLVAKLRQAEDEAAKERKILLEREAEDERELFEAQKETEDSVEGLKALLSEALGINKMYELATRVRLSSQGPLHVKGVSAIEDLPFEFEVLLHPNCNRYILNKAGDFLRGPLLENWHGVLDSELPMLFRFILKALRPLQGESD